MSGRAKPRKPAATRVSARDLAGEARAARRAYETLVQRVLASRAHRCDPKCKGWLIDIYRVRPVRCDECAQLNDYADRIDDDDVATLPAAARAWRRAEREAADAVDYEDDPD